MQTVIPLQPGEVYHLCNRGVNRTDIFLKDRKYAFFMQLYTKYVVPVAETFAYCLMRNHFHLLVRIRTERLTKQAGTQPTEQLANQQRHHSIYLSSLDVH